MDRHLHGNGHDNNERTRDQSARNILVNKSTAVMHGIAVIAVVAAGMFSSTATLAADASAGRATAQNKCVQCHEADDWDGEDAASLQSLIQDIIAGKVKHKGKIELSAAEIANVAAYWAQGKR